MEKPSNVKSSWIAELSWPDVEKRILSGDCGLLPVGAGAKEHGLHLPMNTDYLQAKYLADQLALQWSLLIWPTLSYGYYPAFVDYPGSISLSQNTYELMVKEIITAIFNSGVPKLALLNTGISTILPLARIVNDFDGNVCLINVYSGMQFKQTYAQVIEQTGGGHADESETSIMLAINQSLVDMNLASGSMQACSQPGVLSRNDPESLNYTPTGACGAPQLARSDKGAQLLQSMLTDINKQLSNFGIPAV